MTEYKGLLVKSAMTYGLAMGIYWVIKYIFFILSFSVPVCNYLYWALTFTVPFVAYTITKRYREDTGGQIGFFHAWQFGLLLYTFAALIVSLVHYMFYQYVAPPDLLASAFSQALELLDSQQVNSELVDKLKEVRVTPIQMAIQGIFNNIFYGVIFSIPVAALLCRNNNSGQIFQNNQQNNNK
ncbi:DUF4199 domain-containing protein [Parabacteroides sp. PF5-9]|uniref:DUF4199 domain-containing protein n=1 Tax=Parabacteroides sp. PF5-9 TaxID=1742404 RepID=UPI0024766960|nr:DUF4199 domain-containing protein [Parabacteroides sp. PF5-9]MDH6356804.1 hypothetical protein [Parabacteroides sp. PF5-9]